MDDIQDEKHQRSLHFQQLRREAIRKGRERRKNIEPKLTITKRITAEWGVDVRPF